eukprot:2094637-Amphidinium_carterae.1
MASGLLNVHFGLTAVMTHQQEDNTVKIWSETLMHLRDVVFPQPLTAVSFLRRQDLDGMRGCRACTKAFTR